MCDLICDVIMCVEAAMQVKLMYRTAQKVSQYHES